jgi:hypothetical protein
VKLRRVFTLSLPALLAAGCLLPSFETDASLDPGNGGSGGSSAGSSASGGSDGGAPVNQGGDDQGGAAGSGGGTPPLVTTEDDAFAIVQETELDANVLDNDDEGLSVTGFEDLEADLGDDYKATIDVAADGTLTFEPAPGFFGSYRLSYEVENDAGDAGIANVTIYVQPVAVELAAVAENAGGFCLTGPAGDGVGSAVAAAGDLDGDGFGDLLVGAPATDSSAGAVYAVLGAARPSSFALLPNGEDERYVVLTGEAASELGAAVAPLGDVVGDAASDFMVSAPAGAGVVYVVSGSDAASASAAIDSLAVASLTGGNSDDAGRFLASGFDLTGDDVPDPVVVVSLAAQANVGSYYVLDGAELASGTLAAQAARAVNGSNTNDNASRAAAHVGDVDDDGEADLLLASARVIALLRGPSSGFPDDLLSTSFDNGEGVWLDRLTAGTDPISVTGAGDFDGDGQRDVAYCEGDLDCVVVFGPVSDLSAGLTITDLGGPAWISGGADLVSGFDEASDGAAELLVAQRDAAADPDADEVLVLFGGRGQQAGSLSATGLGDAGFRLAARQNSDLQALSPVGDVNGDGFQDFAVGDRGNDQVCVVFGGPYLR